MKNILLLSIVLIFVSCTKKEVPVAETASIETFSIDSDEYKNPGVFWGTDFISFMKVLCRTQNYDRMLAFTSKISIDQIGRDSIAKFYQNTGVFEKINKLQSIQHGRMTFTSAGVNKTLYHFYIVIENDSCKLLLPKNLNDLGK
jgi:hypothetical protein